ncbi:MAG: DUF2459 domain-containing protein [Flavobacteriales bacterium]
MRTFLKYLLRAFLAVLGVIALYFIVAFILMLIPSSGEETADEKNHTFYVQSNGTHLDIVLPTEAIDSDFREQLHLPGNAKFVSFGWGNKEFYFNVPEWKDLTFGLAFRALFFRLESAMHVNYYKFEKEKWKKIVVAENQMAKLNKFIRSSFVQKDKKIIPCLCPGHSDTDCFYDAQGRYSCVNTCNVWVGDALKAASVKTSVWSPLHWGVLHHLEE